VEAIGQPLSKLHAAELSEADYARLLERVRAGRPTSSTTERRKKNGEIIRVTLKTTPLLDDQCILVGDRRVRKRTVVNLQEPILAQQAGTGREATHDASMAVVS
jgi:hypothetical protein